MYRQFNIQQFYVLPTHCIYVFCVDLRTTAIIYLYRINWFIQFALMFVAKAALSDALYRQFLGLFCNVLLLVDLTFHAAYL